MENTEKIQKRVEELTKQNKDRLDQINKIRENTVTEQTAINQLYLDYAKAEGALAELNKLITENEENNPQPK